MPLTKAQKKTILDATVNELKNAGSVAFINITGVKNNDFIKLKQELKKNGMNARVIKKTLLRLALKNEQFSEADFEKFKHGIAAVISKDEPVSLVKIIDAFTKTTLKKNLRDILSFGFIKKELIDGTSLAQFATMPSREELLARVAFSIGYPLNKLAFNLKWLAGLKLVLALKALQQTKS